MRRRWQVHDCDILQILLEATLPNLYNYYFYMCHMLYQLMHITKSKAVWYLVMETSHLSLVSDDTMLPRLCQVLRSHYAWRWQIHCSWFSTSVAVEVTVADSCPLGSRKAFSAHCMYFHTAMSLVIFHFNDNSYIREGNQKRGWTAVHACASSDESNLWETRKQPVIQ